MSRDTPNPLARRWMRLGEALNEVMTIPLSEGEAKRVLCNAIADKRIEIELGLRKHVTRHMTALGMRFSGAEFHIKKDLEPQTIDFENSRPLEPWSLRWEGHPHMGGLWHVDWLEVDRARVAELVGSASPTGNRKQAQRRKKTQTAREGARRAIVECYPAGVPDQATEPNPIFCERVAAKMQELGLPAVSHDSILRAASRRK